ncbi:PREDICTED: uncharacterized protein LOC108372026 [Rhagoletis zephyria]|uniref:uncharacterized protein LOC108372026 n=1 Tax=Rhagoletis zephyria TaxID=28612 RepID=UPI0008114D9F|nr:PREDICTED: uncharacterized protein LOC108372026 [Rhagoletis zephyria]
MRVNYNTAKQWEGSTGAGSMDGDTIKSPLTKMFSFYEFDDIFGSTLQVPSIIEETLHSEVENFDILNIEYLPDAQDPMSNLSPDIQYLPDAQDPMSISKPISNSSVVNESLSEVKCTPSTSRRGIYSITALSDIMKEKLQIMELEMKERLARVELHLKYET